MTIRANPSELSVSESRPSSSAVRQITAMTAARTTESVQPVISIKRSTAVSPAAARMRRPQRTIDKSASNSPANTVRCSPDTANRCERPDRA